MIADPSHGIGLREYVEPITLAATVAGADGVIVEIHQEPLKAFSDARQTLDYNESSRLVNKLRGLKKWNNEFKVVN